MCPQINHVRFLDFLDLKVDKLWDTFLDTWHVATWVLKIPSPWVVDDFRHWNFSICSKDIGVMAVSMEGCNCKIQEKMDFCGGSIFLHFYWLYPSTKRAITPMSFEQIEKFRCLKSSTTQGLSHGIFRTHVARVTCPKTCLKVCQHYECKNH